MLKWFCIFISVCLSQVLFSQKLNSIAAMQSNIIETSGLLFINDKLYTHTDSDGEAALYEIDTNTAQILKTVYIQNAINIDWEDLAQDDDYIYIADFGNNQGNRTNLAILKLDKLDFLNAQNQDSLAIEKITFSYEDQTNFNSANQNTAFDAEALIAFEDSLYIFTKNWVSQETSVYSLPKTIGDFNAKNIGLYDVDGLVSGANIHPSQQKISLCGYTKLGNAFIFEMKNFNSSSFFQGENKRYAVSPFGSAQIEGICAKSEEQCFVSSEKFFTTASYLHKWTDTSMVLKDSITALNVLDSFIKLYPNPSSNLLFLDYNFSEVKIFDSKGSHINTQLDNPIKIEKLEKGIYFLSIKDNANTQKTIQFEKQ